MADDRATKRVKHDHNYEANSNRNRQPRRWRNQKPQARGKTSISSSGIHNDDVGVFVTCSKGQERRCLDEANDLFMQYTEEDDHEPTSTKKDEDQQQQQQQHTSDAKDGGIEHHVHNVSDAGNRPQVPTLSGDGIIQSRHPTKDKDDDDDDVEADIEAELNALKNRSTNEDKLKLVTLDVPCVCFVKTGKGIDPVRLVHQICSDAFDNPNRKRSRYIKRMTPMSLIRKTLSGGLDDVCKSVLEPHFGPGQPSKKFAIRHTIRNNHDLDRDMVIKTVAKAVGDGHSVDLKNYDLLILVDVYRNVCGMSVVGNDYEKLKKYNLAEIYSPTPKPDLDRTQQAKKNGDVSTG